MTSHGGGPPGPARCEARYANYFEIGVSEDEVVIDLGQAYGEDGAVSLHTRIVTGPSYARELARLLVQATATDRGDRTER